MNSHSKASGTGTGTFRRPGWTRLNLVAVLFIVLAVLAGCANADTNDNDANEIAAGSGNTGDATLDVVVSMPFMPSMVDAVGGDRVDVESIVPRGADAHTYQPTPGDARMVADADLIIVNGLGLEEFLDDLIESAGGVDAPIVELAADLEDAAFEDDHEHEDEDDAHEHEDDPHDHGSGNPHLWLNPEYGIAYVETIANALAEADPANGDDYLASAEDYIAEIREFDSWAQDEIAQIPEENRVMVTFHDAFPYFAEHFGLEIAGVVVTSPGREPGAQEVAGLADEIRETGVPAVFIEPQFNPDLARTIAEEAGVEVLEIYSDTPPEGAGYLEMLEINVERVIEGLG